MSKQKRRVPRIRKQQYHAARLLAAGEYIKESYFRLQHMLKEERQAHKEVQMVMVQYLAFAVEAAGGKVEIDLRAEAWKKMQEGTQACPILVEENKEKKTLVLSVVDEEKY